MNRQQIFDTVLEALRKQGEKSMNAAETCMYRGTNGNKCAVGHLISDEMYNRGLEGNTVGALISTTSCSNFLPKFFFEHETLLQKLQRAHDVYMPFKKGLPMEAWENDMKNIANFFNLDYKKPSHGIRS